MDWLQVLGPALLVVLGGIITWVIRSRIEESRAIQQELNEERRKTYSEILLPFISVFTSVVRKEGATKAVDQMMKNLSQIHKNRLDLVLFGSDAVVRAHNDFWEYAYRIEADGEIDQRGREYMRLFGRILLEIRKDVGNRDTKLDEVDMLRWLIRDIDKLEHMNER